MKLLSMHVDNFGGLHDYDFSFEDGLNVVLHDNGWGKTTMAAFLKAMIYGFDSKRSKNITENERRRYLPWQGGAYGGSLDFLSEGVHYRIYRTFGATPRFDKVRIVDVNTKTSAKIDPDKIGETLFGLDASAFQRSVFINQNGLAVAGAASSIHTRLNALVSQANDVAAYDDAIASLTAQIKVYEKTGGRGQLGDIVRQIAAMEQERDRLEAEINAQDDARDRIAQIDILLSSLGDDLEKKKEQLEAVSGEAKKREAARKLLEDVNGQIAQLQEGIQEILRNLGGRVPDQEEIDEVKRRQQTVAALIPKLEQLEADHAQLQEKLDALMTAYHGKMPAAAELDQIQRLHGELQGIVSSAEPDPGAQEAAPTGHGLIQAAVEADRDYISRLETAVGSQMTLLQYIRKLELEDRDLAGEASDWAQKREKFSTLLAEQAQAGEKLEAQARYAPQRVTPAINTLKELQKKMSALDQKKTQTQEAIQRETAKWAEQKMRYEQLQAEEDRLREDAARNDGYDGKKLAPVIAKLEQIQKSQQMLSVKQENLRGISLSPEQEAWLAEQPEILPDEAEGRAIVQKHRNTAVIQGQLQGLNARCQGEQSGADSLKASLDQLETTSVPEVPRVEEPKKPASGLMMCSGTALVVLGILAAVLAGPVMAALAALGIALVVVGVLKNKRYQHDDQVYQAYCADVMKRNQTEDKKQELRKQLDAVQASLADLDRQIAEHTRRLEADERAVADWMLRWAPDGIQASEAAINRILEDGGKTLKLRRQHQDALKLKQDIQGDGEVIACQRAEVDACYPELKEKTTEEALRHLRNAGTDHRIRVEKLESASLSLARFLKETKVPREKFSQEEAPAAAQLRQQMEKIAEDLEKTLTDRRCLNEQHPEIVGMSNEEAWEHLNEKQSAYQVAESQWKTAQQNVRRFTVEAKASEEQFGEETSPRMEKMRRAHADTEEAFRQAMDRANAALAPLGLVLDRGDVSDVLRRAQTLLHEYQHYESVCKAAAERQEQKHGRIRTLQQKLDSCLPVLQGCHGALELPERIARIRDDISQAAGLREKLSECAAALAEENNARQQAERAVADFAAAYGHFAPKTGDVHGEIFRLAGQYTELAAAVQPLEKQRQVIEKEQVSIADQADSATAALRSQIAGMEDRKDRLLVEYTQKSDFIRQADQALEKLPELLIEIRQLYDQKQKAQSILATLKRTIQLISQAKENLANRYLSKVEQLFNSYMHIWLKNDGVRGILDVDFNITIAENEKIHEAEGYSTGYCDLIDMCMRLALVDTLFEGEQPFLILDDPFVNLDAEHLDKALELLNVMAANKQIVYFVCHPIRAVETKGDPSSRAAFARLAEDTRKTLQSRRSAAAAGKKAVRKSPKELYHVAAGAVPAFQPARPGFVITNSIFSMKFVLSEGAGVRDGAYELFFIDEKGRVLNDRQLLEVRGGKLSAEKVQFCLNSRDDSGEQYELMIQESGQEDYAVTARFPFRAKLAFGGTDQFDF